MNLQNFGLEFTNKFNPSQNKSVVVGVSGGPDSLCLLDLFIKARIPVIAAHFDHHLRIESGDDGKRVELAALKYGVPFFMGEQNVSEFAQNNQLSIEEAARYCRYHFLFGLARSHNAEAVAVAHTADDQVETVLMHLVRGAGLSGLKGMSYRSINPEWDRDIPLIRPLLDTWREEILAYCQSNQLNPVMDYTNMDVAYFRNRLRHQLIPTLADYNPKIKMSILRMAQSLNTDFEILQETVESAWDKLVITKNADTILFNHPILAAQKSGIQRNVMRKAFLSIRPGLRDIDFDSVERAVGFIQSPSRSGKLSLIGGIWLIKVGDRLAVGSPTTGLFLKDLPQLESEANITCRLDSEIILVGGWKLIVNIIKSVNCLDEVGNDPMQAWLDLDLIRQPLTLRARKNGDTFRPLGMAGHHIKLTDLFINHHIASASRKLYPLVYSGEDIIWIPGIRPSETARVTLNTRSILHFELKKET